MDPTPFHPQTVAATGWLTKLVQSEGAEVLSGGSPRGPSERVLSRCVEDHGGGKK